MSSAHSRRVALYAVPLAILFLASIGFEIARKPHRVAVQSGVPCLLATVAARIHAPRGALGSIVTNGDSTQVHGRPVLWYVLPRHGRLAVTRVTLTPNGTGRATSYAVPAHGLAHATAYDMTQWEPSRPALVVARQRRRGLGVTVHSLGRGSHVLASGVSPVTRPPKNVERGLFVARLTGRKPDLFVVDRDRDSGHTVLSVYTGESHFAHAAVLRRQTGAADVSGQEWSIGVARVAGQPSLLVFRTAARSALNRPEVHILEATSGFRTFTKHETLSRTLAGTRLVGGRSLQGPAVYALRQKGTTLELHVVPLGIPLVSPTC